jgi:hypothetical protein
MADLDRTGLAAVERQVLAPEVIERTLERAVAEWARPTATDDRDRIAATHREVDGELRRLTNALAAGADTPSVVRAIWEREVTRTALQGRLANHESILQVATVDLATVREVVRERLTDWQGLMSRHTPKPDNCSGESCTGGSSSNPHPSGRTATPRSRELPRSARC